MGWTPLLQWMQQCSKQTKWDWQSCRVIASKCFCFCFVLWSIIMGFVSASACWDKPFFFLIFPHGVDWWITGISHHSSWWLDWSKRLSTSFMVLSNHQGIPFLWHQKCMWSLPSDAQLGLLLFYLGSMMHGKNLCLLFDITSSTYSCMLMNMIILSVRHLHHHGS